MIVNLLKFCKNIEYELEKNNFCILLGLLIKSIIIVVKIKLSANAYKPNVD